MSNDTILKVTDFTLSYEARYYKTGTARDLFVNICKAPIEYFLNSPDRLVVLNRISFQVKKGERVGILGANGVGKTSLCRYLSKIIAAKEISLYGSARVIFETAMNIYPDLTGRENATIVAELMYPELSRVEKKYIVEESIKFSDLEKFADTTLKTYSKGMRARLFLSLLTSKPSDLIILDEILGGTDQFFTEKINKRINDLIFASGAAIVVSHNLDEVALLCDRVIILANKAIVFDGPTAAGISFYKNLLL